MLTYSVIDFYIKYCIDYSIFLQKFKAQPEKIETKGI